MPPAAATCTAGAAAAAAWLSFHRHSRHAPSCHRWSCELGKSWRSTTGVFVNSNYDSGAGAAARGGGLVLAGWPAWPPPVCCTIA
jgi:hypothetical protein